MSEYHIYAHVSMPGHIVIQHQETYFLVPNIPGGWKQRQLYRSYTQSLRSLGPEEGKQIAARIGLGRGGYRKGAGRTTITGEAMRKKTVTLSKADVTFLNVLGDGNISAGIREAVRRLQGGRD